MYVRAFLVAVALSVGICATGAVMAQGNPTSDEALEKFNRMRALQKNSQSRTFLPRGSANTQKSSPSGRTSVVQSQPANQSRPSAPIATLQAPVATPVALPKIREYAPENQLIYLIHFEFDSAYLRQDSRAVLDEFCQRVLVPDLANHPDSTYIIVGHTDQSGSARYNKVLSEKRAAVTKEYLVNNCHVPGVGLAERIEAVGLGEERPLPGAPSSRQRRVEFQVNI